MRNILRYVVLPALAPLAIVGLYFTPVALIGCANRGLAALAIVFASLIVGIVIGIGGIRARSRGDVPSPWLGACIVILSLPAFLILGPLG